jgi:IclR family pca regulon transcriptional regulator
MIQVVARVDKVLGAFTLERPELTLTECAEASGLTKSSVHRLLLSLEQVGLVERDGPRWRLGPRVVWLASVRLGQFELRREAVSRLQELGRAFRAAAAFSVPDGPDMIYLERQESPEPFSASARLGGRAPIWAGGSGKAVLSRLSAEERDARLDVEEWHRLPPGTRADVLAEVEAASVRGYSIDPGTFFEGVAGVAVPVCDVHGQPVAALSLIVSPERLRQNRVDVMGRRLSAAAAELEAMLGGRPARVPGDGQLHGGVPDSA